MDLLIGIAVGSFVTNMTVSNQRGGTVSEEKQGVQVIVQRKLKYPHIGRYIGSFVDRVQPQTNDELRRMVEKWCDTPDAEKPSHKHKEHISNWDTSLITDMSVLFEQMETFNDDISQWDTSKVTDMFAMFDGARSFNQPIGNWDTSKVIDMNHMFNAVSIVTQYG